MNQQFQAIEALSATDFSKLDRDGKVFAKILFYVAQGVNVRKAIDMVLGAGACGVIIAETYNELSAA